MENDFEEWLVNLDNCKYLDHFSYVDRYKQFQKDVASKDHFWSTLLRTQFENDNIVNFFNGLSEADRGEYFKFGVDCIITFMQANFTGPELSTAFEEFFNGIAFDFKHWLSVDEELNVNTKYPALLVAALCIFKHCKWHPTLNLWWHWRSLMVHQRVLDESSPKLLEEVNQLHKQLEELNLEPQLQALLEIEQAQLYLIYRNITKSEFHLNKARDLLGIKHELAGALGKRTKYQEHDIAQLRLSIEVSDGAPAFDAVHEFVIPKNLSLEDDLRLDTVKFTSELTLPVISDLHQKYLIAAIQHLQISQPRDNLYYEEIKPFFDYILSQNNTWVVRVVVLLMRCKMESYHKRTIERCLLQCEDVVNYLNKETPDPLNRLGGVYTTNFPPIWEIEAQLAELMLNTGLIKASLDIYLRLELWEDVIVCYTLLKLKHKAAEIIRQRLEAKPTVKLWCLLGDATNDVTCYEKAWDFSEKRSSRAQRHWGEYFYFHKKYHECIPHFEKSLSINPLQVNVWLRYGYAALETENWQAAATAYKRYTMLEPGNFQAWNNLAKAYVKLGNKHAAHQALHDAIKFNFDNWKVWDNLMVVSVDTNNFSDVVNAYHRILDLKEKHLALDVLPPLVLHLLDNKTESTNSLLKRTRELLGRLTSIYLGVGFLWELYAELAVDTTTKIQRLQKAYRGSTQSGWEKSVEKCQDALSLCRKLGNLVLSDDVKANDPLIHNVRLNLSSCLVTVKRQSFDSVPEDFEEASGLLQKVIDKCKVGASSSNI